MLVEKGCSSHGEGGWCRRTWNRPQWWVLFWVGIATATANASTTTTNSVVGVILVMVTISSCQHNCEHHLEAVHPRLFFVPAMTVVCRCRRCGVVSQWRRRRRQSVAWSQCRVPITAGPSVVAVAVPDPRHPLGASHCNRRA